MSSVKHTKKELHNLIIQSSTEELVQFYELKDPFMVIMESSRSNEDQLVIHQLTPSTHAYSYPDKSTLADRPLHRHNFIEVLYVLEGQITNRIENQMFTYTAGQCCITNRNVYHKEESEGDFRVVYFMIQDYFLCEITETYRKWCQYMKKSFLSNPIFDLIHSSQEDHSAYDKIYLDIFPVIDPASALKQSKPLFQAIIKEILYPDDGSQFLLMNYFLKLLLMLGNEQFYSISKIKSDASGSQYLLDKIIHIMEATKGRATREDLANRLNYNGEYLNRIVKKYTGKSILAYGQSIYLELFRKRLEETDESISSIIEDLGFSNRSHFYRLFEKAYGKTPQAWRDSFK